MSEAREIPSAVQESEYAAGIQPAENSLLQARCRQHVCSLEPTPDPSQAGAAGTDQQNNIQHRTGRTAMPRRALEVGCWRFSGRTIFAKMEVLFRC